MRGLVKPGFTLPFRHLFVHDLVTSAEARGSGCGTKLIQWLEQQARANGCSRRAAIAATRSCHMELFSCRPLFTRLFCGQKAFSAYAAPSLLCTCEHVTTA